MIANEDQLYDFFDISVEDQQKKCSSCYCLESYEEIEIEHIRDFAIRSERPHKHTVEMYLDHLNSIISKLQIVRSNESRYCPNNTRLDSHIASLMQLGRQIREK